MLGLLCGPMMTDDYIFEQQVLFSLSLFTGNKSLFYLSKLFIHALNNIEFLVHKLVMTECL